MAGVGGGGEYLYSFGFQFETGGFDELLSAIESFAQRAQAGFGSAVQLPEGVSGGGAAGGGGGVPLGSPAAVEGFTQGLSGSLQNFLNELRSTGKLTGDEIARAADRFDKVIANLRTAGGQYATKAPTSQPLYGPNGEVLVNPQDVARERLIANAANSKSGVSSSDDQKDAIDKLYPQASRVADSKFIVDPANRERLNEAIKARAEQLVREREFSNLDNTAKAQALQADEAVRLQAEENTERRRLRGALEKETLSLTGEGGQYAGVPAAETRNQLEAERQARGQQGIYLAGRAEERTTLDGTKTTDIEQEASVKLAQQRDRLSVSLAKAAQTTDTDREQIAKDSVAREVEGLAVREHAVALRQAADAAVISRRLAFAQTLPEGQSPRDQPGYEALGRTTAERQAALAADDTATQAEINARKLAILAEDTKYQGYSAAAAANSEVLAANIKLAAEQYLQGDSKLIETKAQAATLNAERTAQEQALNQQSLAASTKYIKATAEAAVAREEQALTIAAEARVQREQRANDPRGGFDIVEQRGAQAAADRADQARSNATEAQILQTNENTLLLANENLERRALAAAVEKQALELTKSGAAGGLGQSGVREDEVANRLERERQQRADEYEYLRGRSQPRVTPSGAPTSDIEATAALGLARERDATKVGLSRYNQMQETDYAELARLANAHEDTRLALTEYQHLLREESDAAIRAGTISKEAEASGFHPGQTYAARAGEAEAGAAVDAAQVRQARAAALVDNEAYAGAVMGATIAERQSQAQIQAETEAILAADSEYSDNRGQAAASVRSRTSQENALTEELLAEDRDYIDAVASAKVSRQRQAQEVEKSARTQRQESGYDFSGKEAQSNVDKMIERAKTQLAQSEILKTLPAGEQIDLVKGGAGAAADRKTLDAQINSRLAETLRDSTAYKDATAKTAAVKKLLAAEIEAETVDQMQQRAKREGTTAAAILASGAVKRQALEEETKLEILQQQLKIERDKLAAGEQSLAAQRLTTQKQLQIAQREGAQQAFLQSGFDQQGTRFQRTQALIDVNRNGNLRAPEEYQTLGSFFAQRATNTFGYLTSGIAFYGIFDQLKKAVEEATHAQREFQVLKATFEATDQSGKFEQTRSALLDIASQTGRLGSETTNVFRQLFGALGQNVDVALSATSQSLKFAQVTGLQPKEINDSLTAIALSFNQTDFTPFLDQAVHLEQVFGVLPQETVQFAADLAPLAAQLGFTSQQLEAFGASAQAVSGKSGGALAEQFGRVFETFTDPKKMTDLAGVFAREVPEAFNTFAEAIGRGDVEKAFEVLLSNLDRLDKTAPETAKSVRNAVVNIAGGPRQAAGLAAVLARPELNLEALQGKTGDPTGQLQSRFDEVQKSLSQTFAEIQRGIEALFQAVISSGLGDVLVGLGKSIEVVLGTATKFFDLFNKINDLFGGLPGQILFAVGAIKLLGAALEAISTQGFLRAVLPGGIASRIPARLGAAAGVEAAAPVVGAAGETTLASGLVLPAGVAASAATIAPAAAEGGLAAGLGGAATGALAAITPLLGPIAIAFGAVKVAEIVGDIQAANKKAKEARQTFDQKINSEIQKGLTTNQILDDVQNQPHNDLTPDFTFDVSQLTGFLPTGGFGPSITIRAPFADSARQRALKDIMRANANQQNQELGVVLKNLNQDERNNIAHTIASDPRSPEAAGSNTYEQSLRDPGGIEEFVNKFAKNPTNPFLNENVARIIAYARGSLPPDVRKALDAIGKKIATDAETQGLVTQDQAGDLDVDIQTADERLKAGIGSPEEVQRAYDQKLKVLKKFLDSTSDKRVRDALQLQIAKYTQQRGASIASYLKDEQSAFNSLHTATTGQVLPELQQQQALAIAQNPNLDAKSRYDAYVSYIQSQQDNLKQRVQVAQTAGERLKILTEGFTIPDSVRQGVAATQAETSYQSYAEALGVKVESLGKFIGDQVTRFGRDGNDVLKKLLVVRALILAKAITQLEQQKKEAGIFGYGTGATEAIDAQIAGLKGSLGKTLGAYDQLNQNPPADVTGAPSQGTASPQDILNATIASNKEKAQKLQSLQDLSAAQQRDPIATARANIEKARIAKANAAPDSQEFLQALIDEQNAINALGDAQDQITQAFISLAQAQTRDPLEKARLGVQAAYVAVAQAHGQAESLHALAGLAQAQQAMDDAQQAIVKAYNAYGQAQTRDPVQRAQLALGAAQQAAANAHGAAEYFQAMAGVVQSQQAVQDAQNEVTQAMFSLAEVRTRDPVERARFALDAALAAAANAHGQAEYFRLWGDVVKAQQALEDAQNQIAQAMYSLGEVMTTNPITAASYAAAAAAANVANAHDVASQMQAQAEKIKADRAFRDAIYAVANSQVQLLEAYANAAGDTVQAANIGLQLARQKLSQVLAATPDDRVAVNTARADVASAERAAEDATLKQREDDIQFSLDMRQITKQQAISMLQALLTIPTNTLDQQRTIQRQIEQLKQELGQDFKFNLPSVLGLPTLYEARRLNQSATVGVGGYQDNRVININVNAQTDANPQQIANVVMDALGGAPRAGVRTGAY